MSHGRDDSRKEGRTVLILAALLAAALGLFPPWRYTYDGDGRRNVMPAPREFLFSPPEPKGRFNATVDVTKLLIEWLSLTAGTAAIALVLMRRWKPGTPSRDSNLQASGGLIFCVECGAQNPLSARYCRRCGREMFDPSLAEDAAAGLQSGVPTPSPPPTPTSPPSAPPAPRRDGLAVRVRFGGSLTLPDTAEPSAARDSTAPHELDFARIAVAYRRMVLAAGALLLIFLTGAFSLTNVSAPLDNRGIVTTAMALDAVVAGPQDGNVPRMDPAYWIFLLIAVGLMAVFAVQLIVALRSGVAVAAAVLMVVGIVVPVAFSGGLALLSVHAARVCRAHDMKVGLLGPRM